MSGASPRPSSTAHLETSLRNDAFITTHTSQRHAPDDHSYFTLFSSDIFLKTPLFRGALQNVAIFNFRAGQEDCEGDHSINAREPDRHIMHQVRALLRR